MPKIPVTEAPATGTGLHRTARAAKKQAKVLLRKRGDFPCLVDACPERNPTPLMYCRGHGIMALRGLILGKRPVTASERLWLVATQFRDLLNRVQEESISLDEAQAQLWNTASQYLLTDAPFHDLNSNLPFEAFLEARHEEFTWAGVVGELRERLPFTLVSWATPSPDQLYLTIALDRRRSQVLGKPKEDFVRELALFLKLKKDHNILVRVSLHLPVVSRVSKKKSTSTNKPIAACPDTDYYPTTHPNQIGKENTSQWQQSPLPPPQQSPEKPCLPPRRPSRPRR